MSQTLPSNPMPSSSSNFQAIFNTAVKAYEKKTKKDLLLHPLASQLQTCDSPASILSVLQGQVVDLDQARGSDERLIKWLGPTINVLLAFSDTLGEGVSLVLSPAKVIFAGAGVLLQAAKDVIAAQEALFDIFERIENFFKRVETYTSVRPSAAMTDIIVKIMVEVLNVFAIATKEIRQGRTKKYLKKLLGKTDIEDALKRLDTLTQEEARMATVQLLMLTHGVDDKVNDIGDAIRVVHDDGKETKAIVQLIANNVSDEKRSQWRQRLLTWFSSPDPSTNHIISCRAQHDGTAGWFFRGSIFDEWKTNGSLLWIHGKPGSGKSVLCSAVIQDIMTLHDAGLATVAYFYFDFRDTDKQNHRNLLLSLLSQLSARSDLCCGVLHRVYVTHDNGARKPTDEVLIQSLKEVLTLSNDRPFYIIMDAIDECPSTFGMPSPRESVLKMVTELVELNLPNLHICVTSRPEIDIRTSLEPLTSLRVSLHDETGQTKDIAEYVRAVVQSDVRMGKWRVEDQNLIIETLSERADGMFRWVFCQLETVRQCFPPSLRSILQQLPESLDETYERVLKNINLASRGYAHRLLQCLTVAVRPLRLEELAEVLAFDFDDAPGGIPKLNSDWRREDQEHAVLSTCSSLITVVHDGESRVVQFSHFSVKEFLTSDRLAAAVGDTSFHHIDLELAHTILAQACLGVLLRLDDIPRETSVERFPLAEYAAEHWAEHAKLENVSLQIQDGTDNLFDVDKPYFSRWIQIYDIDHWYCDNRREKNPEQIYAAPMYYAAFYGLRDVVEKLITAHPEHVNVRGGVLGTALHAASEGNYIKVVQSLLKHGADVNSQGRFGRTPLFFASYWGHLELGQCLLEHGADVNARDDNLWTPLHASANRRHLEFLRMLLRHNADTNAQDVLGETPLHCVSDVDTARLLLHDGADPIARAINQSTPLHRATNFGKVEVVRLLLERGADVDAVDDEGNTPYLIALNRRRDDIAQLMLERAVEKV